MIKNILTKLKLAGLLCLLTVFSGSLLAQDTWYSFIGLQNSAWNNSDTWTKTPGGTDSNFPGVPSDGDFVFIVGNRNVVLTEDVATTNLTITIEAGSTLTIGQFEFTATILELDGKGLIRINKSYFPAVTTNGFVTSEGGTVEFHDFSGLLPITQGTYNNLFLNNTNGLDNAFTLGHNLTLNGNLTLTRTATSGSTRLTVGNSTDVRSLSISGNVTVGVNAFIGVGLFNSVHQISITGNLVNNGSISLSNSAQYSVSTNGAAEVTFTGASNNSISGTGSTLNFYRLIVDKGVDQTFILDVNPLAFSLYYVTNLANGGADPNPIINKALWIRNGTLKLGPNVTIPVLSEGGNDFFIPLNGALWINGATVSSTSTTGGSGNTGLTVIGKFRVSAGTYNGNKSAGIVFRGTAEMIFEGGTVNVSQIRRSIAAGVQIASYTQSGGEVNVGGGGETNNTYARFSLELSTHTFNMSGGTLNVLSPTTAGAFAVASDPGYYNVSGGTVNITIPTGAANVAFCSKAPVFNLSITKTDTGTGGLSLADISSIGAQPLVVNNNLTLNANARLLTNNLNVSIAGNLNLEDDASYVHGTNTTTFFWYSLANNSGSYIINNSDTSPLTFNNVTISKNDAVNNYNDAKTVYLSNATASPTSQYLNILGDLVLSSSFQTIDFNDYSVRLQGDFVVAQESRILNDPANGIILQPATPANQNLTIGKLSSANNFDLNNTSGATITEATTMGALRLSNGSLTINGRLLTVHSPITFNGEGFSESKMIVTNGSSGDNGLRYRYRNMAGAGTYIYPVGVTGKYTPFTMTLTGGASFSDENNYIGVLPVNGYHPIVVNEAQSTSYYWKTKMELLSTPNLDVNLRFDFKYVDRITAGGAGARRAFYIIGTTVSQGPNGSYTQTGTNDGYIVRSGNQFFQEASFLGATVSAFAASTGRSFQSIASGNWTDGVTVWEQLTGGGTPAYPVAGDQAEIVSGHTITTTASAEADELNIASGGVLDLVNTTGHSFTILIGDGTIRTSSGTLPTVGDNLETFTETNNSTIEFYGAGTYTLPTTPLTYYNLLITGAGTKTLPNANLNIRNRLSVEGAPVLMSNGANGNLTIVGQLNVQDVNGSLTIRSGNNRTLLANNLNVGASGQLVTENAGTNTHSLTLTGGGINVNATGTINLYGNGTNVCNVTLSGPGSTTIGGTNGSTRLNRLVVNKDGGLVDEVVVTGYLQISGPTNGATKALELTKGTFIIQSEGTDAVDITLSSGGTFFLLPETAALIVRGEPTIPNKVRISGGSGMRLDGLFRLDGNAQALFNTGENYLEYSSSGNARLEIMNNALLNLGGQLRRTTTETSGILKYLQTGGEVYIASQGASQATRGVFEVLNIGSSFTHTGGVLSIGRSSNNPSGDIFLEPATYNIGAGATLTINAVAAGQNVNLRSNIPLNNLTIRGANSPTVTLNTHTLTLNGNFLLENLATFNTNNLNQTYRGNFSNAGTFQQGTSTSYFGGGAQTIEGTTSFYNLFLEPTTSVTLQPASPLTVDRDMTILMGTLNDGGNYIDVKRHLYNNSVHVSSNPAAGGIRLSGSVQQLISTYTESAPTTEVATFGRLELDNSAGARLVNSFNLTNNLTLTTGILNIQNRLLSLGISSSIQGGPFSVNRMIQGGGDMGDEGLSKYFDSSVTNFTFTYPIGVAGKYTPLTMSNVTLSPNSFIKVVPINNYHPTIITGDPNRVLQYYWDVSGNLSSYTGDMVFTYIDGDALGDQSLYYTAHLKPADDTWAKLDVGVDEVAKTITFTHNSVSLDNFEGYYTAGEDDAIPDQIAVYTADNSGDWDEDNNWDQTTSPPNGVIVDIPNPYTIDILTQRKRVYKTRLFGVLDISAATTFHNLGIVSGTGKLKLNNDFLPPGNYIDFISCSAGTLEYSGAGPYTITNRYLSINNLIISGTDIKKLPDDNFQLCGNLDINETATLEIFQNRNLNIRGNFSKVAAAGFTANTGTRVIFSGTSAQSLNGTLTGSNGFFDFQMNNSNGLTINGQAEVVDDLYLTAGIVTTTNPFILSKTNGLIEYSSSSYISGPFQRRLSNAAGTYFFPIGKSNRYKLSALIDPSIADEYWTMEYFRANPGNTGSVGAGVSTVSEVEYWELNGPSGESASIQFSLSGTSDVAAAVADINDLRIVRWSGAAWEIVGGGATVVGPISNGTITTTGAVTFSGANERFTLATVVPVTIPTAGFVTADVTVCALDLPVTLEIELTGTPNWLIDYTANGVAQPQINTALDPHPLSVSPAFTTTYTLTNVRDNNGASVDGGLYNESVTVTVIQVPLAQTVVSGGNICSGQSTTITIQSSDSNFSYELVLNGTRTGNIQQGVDGDLTFTNITVGGEYRVYGFTSGYPNCYVEMSNAINIVEFVTPTATISLDPADTACGGDEITINIVFTGTNPFEFKILRTFVDELSNVIEFTIDDAGGPITHASADPFAYEFDTPAWYDNGVRPAEATQYTYTLIEFTDTNGCPGTTNSVTLDIWKRPETGPQFHIPNTFGE